MQNKREKLGVTPPIFAVHRGWGYGNKSKRRNSLSATYALENCTLTCRCALLCFPKHSILYTLPFISFRYSRRSLRVASFSTRLKLGVC